MPEVAAVFTHILTGSCSPFYVLWLETEVVGIADSRARKIVLGKVPAGLNMRPSACKADTLKPMYYSSELLIKGWVCFIGREIQALCGPGRPLRAILHQLDWMVQRLGPVV